MKKYITIFFLFMLCSVSIFFQKKYQKQQNSNKNNNLIQKKLLLPDKNLKEKKQIKKIKNMVYIEGGTFFMGDNEGARDEKPIHQVTLKSFYIGKYEVTQKEYFELLNKKPSHFKGDNLPVEQISWYDAIKFCNTKSKQEGLNPCYKIIENKVSWNWKTNGYRLPTEAEWEYACKGGNKSKNYKYSGSNNIHDIADYNENDKNSTKPVGSKKPNELGIYDMSGNVWEWCWDWKTNYNNLNKINPKGSKNGSERIIRGGCWGLSIKSYRSTSRGSNNPFNRPDDIGFRLCRNY